MTIDLHTHGKLAKNLSFSREYTSGLFHEAAASGLDAICLTEHFNTLGFEPLYEYLRDELPRDGDCFLCEGFRIFPGMEIDIAEGGHVLAIGTMEDITALYERLADNRGKDQFLSANQLLPLLREYPVIIGAAHPFREGGHIPELAEETLRGFDYIELNGKDAGTDSETVEARTYALAKRVGLPVIAGSDTHQALQFGCIHNSLARECATVEELRDLLLGAAYEIILSDTCAMQVRSAGLLKSALKEIDALGGDYAAILLQKTAVTV